MDNAALAVGGIVYLILVVLAAIVAVMWIIFPVIVVSKTNKLIKQQADILLNLTQLTHVANKMERHLESAQKSVAQVAPQQANFYYSVDGQQQGPLTASDLKSLHNEGMVNDETAVLREGDSEWKQYRHFLALNR